MSISFVVLPQDFARLAAWYQFFAPEEADLEDRVLAEKVYRFQWDPPRKPGVQGGLLRLSTNEATRIRIWYDYIPTAVVDESDEDYAERLDDFLARYA